MAVEKLCRIRKPWTYFGCSDARGYSLKIEFCYQQSTGLGSTEKLSYYPWLINPENVFELSMHARYATYRLGIGTIRETCFYLKVRGNAFGSRKINIMLPCCAATRLPTPTLFSLEGNTCNFTKYEEEWRFGRESCDDFLSMVSPDQLNMERSIPRA